MQRWYEKFNFYEDPFLATPGAFETVGTNGLLDELTYRINSGSMVFLEGGEGSGKTAVLRQLIGRFRGRGKVIYFDCASIAKSLNIERLMKERYGLTGRIFGIIPRDMILLLDGVSHLSKRNSERVKYYFDQNYIKSVVFTGDSYSKAELPESVRHRIGKRIIRMPQFTEEMAVELVRKRIGDEKLLTNDIIKKIYKHSGSSPKRLLENCSMACRIAFESGAEQVGEEHLRIFGEG